MAKKLSIFEETVNSHAFPRELMTLSRKHVLPSFSPRIKKKPTLTRFQGYILSIAQRVGHLTDRLQSMEQAIIFLSSYQTSHKWKGRYGRADYLRYHNEVLVTNAIAIFDRCIHLVSSVFDLGFPEKRVNRFAVLENVHVAKAPAAKALKALAKTIESRGLRKTRNELIHMSAYTDDELQTLEMLELLAKGNPKDLDDVAKHMSAPEVIKAGHYQYRHFRIKECDAMLAAIRNDIDGLLTALQTEFRHRSKLKEAGVI